MRKLLRKRDCTPRVLITDKLKSYAAANRDLGSSRTPPAQRAEQQGGKPALANAGAREGEGTSGRGGFVARLQRRPAQQH
jgi:transposase-like protein